MERKTPHCIMIAKYTCRANTRSSSEDEIANVNLFPTTSYTYDVRQGSTIDSRINSATDLGLSQCLL